MGAREGLSFIAINVTMCRGGAVIYCNKCQVAEGSYVIPEGMGWPDGMDWLDGMGWPRGRDTQPHP